MAGVTKYKKRPVKIEAVQWTGKNRDEVEAFVGGAVRFGPAVGEDAALLQVGCAFPSDFIVREGSELLILPKSFFETTYEPATSTPEVDHG